MVKTKKKEAQKELPGMPDRTPAGRYAVRYLEIKDEIEKGYTELEKCGKNLIEAMNQENKSVIHINGRALKPKYLEARITVAVTKEV